MKKLISVTLAGALALSLAACGSTASVSESAASSADAASSEAASTAETGSDLAGTTIKVAASPTPHAEILGVAKDLLAEQGITLDIIEFSDYVQPTWSPRAVKWTPTTSSISPTWIPSTRRTAPIW